MNLLTKRSNIFVGLFFSAVCVVYNALFRTVPVSGDIFLALPIAKEFAHAGLYSPYDLLVSSGIRGPFHLYKYLGGFLYLSNVNIDIAWYIFFLLSFFLTFVALWFLSLELTGNTFSSILFLAIIAVAHPLRGSLHAAAVPIPAFITAAVALPFAFFSIILLLRKQFFAAMLLGSFLFNIHPYIGLLISTAVATVIFFDSEKILRKRFFIIFAGSLCALPNVIYILTHLPSNFSTVEFDFYSQFRLYAMHAFINDHWREGYGWFFLNVAGAMFFGRYIEPQKRRVIWILCLTWFVLMILYAFNSYVTKNTAVLLMFLFRATYFIKPIIFIFVVNGIYQWNKELRDNKGLPVWWMPWKLYISILLLFFSSILPMKFAVIADVLALLAYTFILLQINSKTKIYSTLGYALILMSVIMLIVLVYHHSFEPMISQEALQNIVVGVVITFSLLLFFVFYKFSQQQQIFTEKQIVNQSYFRIVAPFLSVLIAHQLIISIKDKQVPFIPDIAAIQQRIFMHQPPRRTVALMEWAKRATPQNSLFVIPPDNDEDFASFRIVTERGVYITISDVNQLAFDALVYRQVHQRILGLGVTIPDHRVFDTRGYYTLTIDDIRRLAGKEHADYLVYEKNKMTELSLLPKVYQDEYYVVINLHDTTI